MTLAQKHRGPDDQGIEILPTRSPGIQLGLGHRRLAILDLSAAGHQPMHEPETGLWTVYNGEIYNHLELRRQLPGEYHSTCDTETLLRAIARWGDAAVARFRGMFAFALWDPARNELFLCRDRLGIKPLYYAQVGANFVFASELRAILASELLPRRLDPEGVNGYLAFGAVQEPSTIVQGVRSLPAGHWLRFVPGEGIREIRRYWAAPFQARAEPSANGTAARSIGRLVADAVECRLLSDVPLGAFLSGGIDSSAIVASMARRNHRAIRSFTLNFSENGYGEGPFAEKLAAHYQTQHITEQVSANDLLGHFEEALDAADQPSVDGINTYYVCKLARRAGLTVALCGHGGDELFGGYDNFRLIPRVLRFRRIPGLVRKALGKTFRYCTPTRVATRKAASLLAGPVGIYETYGLARSIFWDEIRRDLFACPDGMVPAGELVRKAVPPTDLAADPVNQVSQLELSLYLRNTLLRDTDVFSMAHGLEVRVPLLDHQLVEYVASLPGQMKIEGSAPKRLLVKAMDGALPPEIHLRRKQGFVIPYEIWMRDALRPIFDSILRQTELARSIGLSAARVSQVWDQFLQGHRGINMQHPLALYVLMRWCVRNKVAL